MAKLIVKSGYIKPGGSKSAGGYLNYIGTRERVQILPDDRPPTRKQEQLIQKLLKDFPSVKGLPEYDAYSEQPTKYNASQLITQALEENWSEVSSVEGYAKYIANRPRAERIGSHGLFGDEDYVNLDAAMEELKNHGGNVWTHILSLRREDAVRLGYDHADTWRDLLRSKRNELAAAMNIPVDHLRWYAAFHDEGHHPHAHMMAWSSDPKEGYLSEEGLRQIKSQMTNEIFQMELLHIYEDKSQTRDQLVTQARKELSQLARELTNSIGDSPRLEQKLMELAKQLPDHGKKSYGYLPKAQKKLVDEIVDELTAFPVVRDCYRKWMELQHQVESYYKDVPMKEIPLSQQKEFRSVKNAIIHEAERIRLGRQSFEDSVSRLGDEAERSLPGSAQLQKLWQKTQNDLFSLAYRQDAMDEIREYAETGDAYAQYCMGKIYREGKIVIPDAEIVKAWLKQAAAQDLSSAQYALADLLLSNDLTVQDHNAGWRWMGAAAENGNSAAQYRMGKDALRNGDRESAADWFHRAADQGSQYAQYMLGKLYLQDGESEKAIEYFSMAASLGNTYAQYFLDRQDQLHHPSAMLAATRLFQSMANLFQDNARKQVAPGLHIDQKRRRELMAKRQAVGIRDPIQDETYGYGQSM